MPLTAYQLLGVDPAAPADLISAAYWMAVAELQPRRTAGPEVDATLHAVTRAYETLSDHKRRAAYDASIGFTGTAVMTRRLPKQDRSWLSAIFRRLPGPGGGIDYYEIIGLDPSVSPERIPPAYAIMRDYYLRAPDGWRRKRLIGWLDEAYSALTDAARRRQYDEGRVRTRKHRPPAAGDPSVARRPAKEKPAAPTSGDVAKKPATGASPAAPRPAKPRQKRSRSKPSPGGAALTSQTKESNQPGRSVDGARPRTSKPDESMPARPPSPASVEPPAADWPARRSLVRAPAGAAPAIARALAVAAAAASAAIRSTTRGVDSGCRRLLAGRRSTGGAAGEPLQPESMPKPSARQPADIEETLLHRLASTVQQTETAPTEGEQDH